LDELAVLVVGTREVQAGFPAYQTTTPTWPTSTTVFGMSSTVAKRRLM
jgi:hypothetical protein